ncbi:hypothetical protein [Halegenticoccus tardaugens]|uniref:hypothetical protein n=1 Tax=Halegenticoccus tardaugens TaxID=2071624 RepID=UPI00100B77DB|nr:hypothetical protein [Halegenticoccus tardaugens]
MPRALLTDREKDVIRDDESVDPATRSTLLGRIEQKIYAMKEDTQLLRTHRPDLATQLEEHVCSEVPRDQLARHDQQIQDLQETVEDLKERLDDQSD